MGYRLTRKELRIIERTKQQTAGSRPQVPAMDKLRPYIYFILIFLTIAIGVSLMVFFTK